MISLIFLAGGIGTRMGAPTPKQFLPLNNKLLALHSYEMFAETPMIKEIVVVCEEPYQHFFKPPFALPGKRRQDSVYSGLLKTTQEIILIHDAARPFIEAKYIPLLIEATLRTGAAALGSPVTSTIKEANSEKIVQKTLNRDHLWEIQTPQGIKRELLFRAFDNALKNNLDVTDDLSMVEAMGAPAEIVPCTSKNFKITTPFDLELARMLCATN